MAYRVSHAWMLQLGKVGWKGKRYSPISPAMEVVLESSEGDWIPRIPTMLPRSWMRAGLGVELCCRVVSLQ